jgi:2-polyprenyl-3-methyl-5-hydroxy-6-metoxy-1,4-benzoquinol methylase
MNNDILYEHKDHAYFSFVRTDIGPLLPSQSNEVIELGCGDGNTLAWLKELGYARHTTGMELCAEPAAQARKKIDRVIEGDLQSALPQLEKESFDMVLCLDVLEHLNDPWTTVKQLYSLLRPGGSIVISVPNIRHYSVLLPLLWHGTWRYQDAGIMDKSHLRFFSRESAQEMLTQNGFNITASIDNGLSVNRKKEFWKAIVAKTSWRDLCVFQFLIRAEKPLNQAAIGVT